LNRLFEAGCGTECQCSAPCCGRCVTTAIRKDWTWDISAADPQQHQFQNPSARTGSEGGAQLLLLHYSYFSKNVRTKWAW